MLRPVARVCPAPAAGVDRAADAVADHAGARCHPPLTPSAAAVTVAGAGVVIPATAAHAADSALGIDVGNIAYNQLYSDSADVQERLSEKGANCNFYTGFWADPNNDRYDNNPTATCGNSSKGYEYRDGTKSWVTVNWRARAWRADFAKFAFYCGTAKYTSASSRRTTRTTPTAPSTPSRATVPTR